MNHLPTITLNGTTYFIDEKLLQLRDVKDPNDFLGFDSSADLYTYTFWTEQLQPLIGSHLLHAEMVYDDTLNGWKPVLTFDDGKMLELLQDEEGNGPGRFAYIE